MTTLSLSGTRWIVLPYLHQFTKSETKFPSTRFIFKDTQVGPEESFVALGLAKSKYAFLSLSPVSCLFFRQESSDITQTGLKFSVLPQLTNAGDISVHHHSQKDMPFCLGCCSWR